MPRKLLVFGLLSCVCFGIGAASLSLANAVPANTTPIVASASVELANPGTVPHNSSHGQKETVGHSEAELPINPPHVFEIPLWKGVSIPVTNSMIMLWGIAGGLILLARISTLKMSLVPGKAQNIAEWLVESLQNFFAGILGQRLAKSTLWFNGSVFVLILCLNWLGLLPGVGSIFVKGADGEFVPLLRGANADVGITLSLSMVFAVAWFIWAIRENGFIGFFKHIFAPKGDLSPVMKLLMIPIFLFIGCIEFVSIMIRPVALTFRLFGNVYGGESIIDTMANIVPHNTWYWWLIGWMPVFCFYCMELLVGIIQAMVFTLLTAVFLKLICEEEEEEHGKSEAEQEESHATATAKTS